MRILGIDPGSRVVGFACLDMTEGGPRFPSSSSIRNLVRPRFKGGSSQLGEIGVWQLGTQRSGVPDRLRALAEHLGGLVRSFEPDVIAVEAAFYGKSVSSALRLGEARGVVLLVAAQARVAVAEYPPALVKRRVTGHGSATKENVARTLAQEFGATASGLPHDASDALAIAWCHVLEQSASSWELADGS